MKQRAVFLDRDGTLILDKHYLHKPEELELYPETVAALRILVDNGYALVVISNQSGVARGYFDEAAVKAVNRELICQLQRKGIELAGVYHCPHLPGSGNSPYVMDCECRKPKPGMVLRAARELSLELSGSWIVGDKACDIILGQNTGLFNILVRTGHGREQEKSTDACQPEKVTDNILQAARYIASQEGKA